MIRRLRSPWTRLATVLAVAAPVLTVLGAPPAHAAPAERFSELREWTPSFLPDGNSFDDIYSRTKVVFDEQRRLMWVAIPGLSQMISSLAAYDADTLQPRSAPLMLPAAVSSVSIDPATGHAIVVQSAATHVVFGMLVPETPVIDAYALNGKSLTRVWRADLSKLGAGVEIASLAFDPAGRAAYIASQPSGVVAGLVTLSRLDLSSATPAVQWSTVLPPTCPEVPSNEKFNGSNATSAMGVNRGAHALYLMCGVPEEIQSIRPPLAGGVGKVALGTIPSTAPSPSAFSLFPIAGDFHESTGSVFDAATGRFMIDESNQEAGSVVVFDTTSDHYVGLVDGGLNTFGAVGFDDVSGRLYMMEQNPQFGLLVSDTRTTPPSQPTKWPQWYFQPTVWRIPVDGATSRVFLFRPPGANVHATYRILRDNQPPVDVSERTTDPDSNTTDMAEEPGMTGVTYNASAQGYGAVLRQVGGAQSAVQDAEGFFHVSGNSDPELRAAYLNSITLSTDEATASSTAADRDWDFTGTQQTTVCGSTPAQLQDATCPWPYPPAICASFDTLAAKTAAGPAGTATSSCSAAQHSATTQAEYTGGDLGGVTVGAVSTTASLLEDPVAGAGVEVTSEARDISMLGGALRIARVATTATAHAHGRKGTAGTTFTRSVEGVVLNGTSLCDGTCNLDLVSTEVEAAFPGRLRITFPAPDAGFATGSPGGFQALVRLGDAEHLDDVQLNSQPADRLEVPGMKVVSMFDTMRPSRTVLTLAGVEAEARYGIYPLDQFTADQADGLVPSDTVPTLPVAGGDLPTIAPVDAVVPGVPPSRAAAAPAPLSGLPALFGWHGWQWALTHPGDLLRLAAVWLVFLIPVYLSARRWSLLRRHHLEVDLT
jgi:hypothetical protein